jgi:cytoskeletal protein CcmA (bactofilin family)
MGDAPRATPPLRENLNLVNDAPRGPTVIGPQAVFVGEISGDEDLLVEGRLEGKIRTDRKVTVGGTGDVRGDILARSVVLAGRVQGQIQAQERAELLASASVNGSIQAPKVIIAEGAQLHGNVTMSAPAKQVQAQAQTQTQTQAQAVPMPAPAVPKPAEKASQTTS